MTLRETIIRGRLCVPEKIGEQVDTLNEYKRSFLTVRDLLISGEPKLINGQTVLDDICNPDIGEIDWPMALSYKNVPRPLPPFRYIWLEARNKLDIQRRPIGVIIQRWQFNEFANTPLWTQRFKHENLVQNVLSNGVPKWIIECVVFVEHMGAALASSTTVVWLMENECVGGSVRFGNLWHSKDERDLGENNKFLEKMHTGFILSALGRMNCHNVRLEPAQNTSLKHQRAIGYKIPSTVWHEIKVNSFIRSKKEHRTILDVSDDEHTEIRFHWVRGHYADYTKGSGLFGNPDLRAVFWMPEHNRGSKEAGEVVSSYAIQ